MAEDGNGLGVPATRIGRRPGGTVFTVDVFLQYSKPLRLDEAIGRALLGKMVFVRRDDAPAVLARLERPS